MGLSGSTHIKVGDSCYDTSKEYAGGFGPGLALSSFLIVGSVATLIAFAFGKRDVAKWIVGITVCLILVTLIDHFTSKARFAAQYGTKVPCPEPKPECDSAYNQYLNDSKTKSSYPVYMCDDRLKYS